MIYTILKELERTNSRNAKIAILENTKNENFKEFLELVFDKLRFKYYITNHQISYDSHGAEYPCIQEIKDNLEPLYTREITGHTALNYLQNFIDKLSPESQHLLKCILDRDLHCGVNMKTAEKVYGALAFKMPYMRCSLIDKLQNIKFPAMLQVKEDGTYRTFVKNGLSISAFSRSGEEYQHPKIFEAMKDFADGAYIGELIVNNLEGDSAEIRYASNGALNSLNPPEDVTFYVWDYLTLQELQAKKSSRRYEDRFQFILENCQVKGSIESVGFIRVDSYAEAQHYTKEWISQGYEGAVLKDLSTPFEDKTSKFQIKLKQEIEIDARCKGFTTGNGKFADTFGAIEFETDDGLLKGQCSGISDSQRLEIAKNKESYIGKIVTIKGNDITQAKDSKIYGVMHPQFIGFRNDKKETDTIERIQNMLKGF